MPVFVRLVLVLVVLTGSACQRDWSHTQDPDASDAASSEGMPPDGGVPQASLGKSEPTLGAIVSGGAPRRNGPAGAGSLVLQDDGFELGSTTCLVGGACLTGSITP